MSSFVNDPVAFMNRWVGSQSKDLEMILGDTRMNLEETRFSEFYDQEQISEALFHYMAEKE